MIGIYICHLWIIEIFDVLLSTSQAVIYHSGFNLWLNVFAIGLFILNHYSFQMWHRLLSGLEYGSSLYHFCVKPSYLVENLGFSGFFFSACFWFGQPEKVDSLVLASLWQTTLSTISMSASYCQYVNCFMDSLIESYRFAFHWHSASSENWWLATCSMTLCHLDLNWLLHLNLSNGQHWLW